MRAARIHEFGGSEKVVIEDLPIPRPRRGEALVRVRAAAVNPADWMIRERMYNPEGVDAVPMTLGQDFAGVIEELGPGADGELREGDAVLGEVWGSFAESVAVPVKDLVRKPKGLDFEVAACLPMPGLTAWQLVNRTARAAPGMTFLVHGAGGGVGSMAAQLARMKEARVVATASPPSFDYLRRIGVEQIIDYTNQRFEEEVRDVDVVIDPLGGELQRRSWPVLKRGGMLLNLVGEIDENAADEAGVRGVAFAMEYDRRDLQELARLADKGLLEPRISRVMPLEQVREALDLNQQNRSHGKIVLKIR